MIQEPEFEHSCEDCIFLERWDGKGITQNGDMYFCESTLSLVLCWGEYAWQSRSLAVNTIDQVFSFLPPEFWGLRAYQLVREQPLWPTPFEKGRKKNEETTENNL